MEAQHGTRHNRTHLLSCEELHDVANAGSFKDDHQMMQSEQVPL